MVLGRPCLVLPRQFLGLNDSSFALWYEMQTLLLIVEVPLVFVPVVLVGKMGEYILDPESDPYWGYIYSVALLLSLLSSQILAYNGNWQVFLLSLKVSKML